MRQSLIAVCMVLLLVAPSMVGAQQQRNDELAFSDHPLIERIEQIASSGVKSPRDALAQLTAIRPEAMATDDPEVQGDWHHAAALLTVQTGELDAALDHIDKAAALYQPLQNPELDITLDLTRASVLAQLGRYRETIALLENVLDRAESLENPDETRGHALLGLGDAYAVVGNFAMAMEKLTDAYAIFRAANDVDMLSHIYGLLGNVYSDIDASEQAIEMYERATELDRELGDQLNVAVNLYNTARALTDIGELDRAAAAYQEALEISERVGSAVTAAYVRYGLGLNLLAQGELAKSRLSFAQSAQSLESIGDEYQLAMARSGLAEIEFREGHHQEALEQLLLAIPALERSDNEKNLVRLLGQLAEVHAALGNYENAYQHSVQRDAIMERFAADERARRTAHLRVRMDTDIAEDNAKVLALENQKQGEALAQEQRLVLLTVMGLLVLAVVSMVLIWSLARQIRMREKLKRVANTDDLTGQLSRRRLFHLGEREISLARRHDLPLAALIMDLDYFKRINDQYGHAVGDKVLCHVASVVAAGLRDTDHFGRIGGEEFIAILPHTDREAAMEVAERLVTLVSDLDLASLGADDRVTVSVGLSMLVGPEDRLTAMIKRADEALYRAKNNGRNQVWADWLEPMSV